LLRCPFLKPKIRYINQPMMGIMAIKCHMILAFNDPKSLSMISIKASMVKPKDMVAINRTYKMVWSIKENLSL